MKLIPDPTLRPDDQKVVWFINHYAGGPGISVSASYRAYELGKVWRAQGFKVLVVMSSYAGPAFQGDQHPVHTIVDGIEYVSVKTNRYKGNGFGRLLNIALFSSKLFFLASRVPERLSNPNVVIYSTVHPFGIFGAKYLARKLGAKLIYEVRDLWPLTLTELVKKSAISPLVLASRFAQYYSCKHADLVASVLPKADEYYRNQKISIKKFLWVPNGAGEIKNQSSDSNSIEFQRALDTIKLWRSAGKTILVHAGAMGPPNMIEEMVDGVVFGNNTVGDKSVCFLLVGDGILREKLLAKVNELELDTFHFTGKLNRAETEKLVTLCDIGYLGVSYLPGLYQYGISPNKVITYIQGGVLVAMTGLACGDPVSESGCGSVAIVNGDKEYWELVKGLADIDQVEKKEMIASGRRHLAKYYNYQKIASDYSKHF